MFHTAQISKGNWFSRSILRLDDFLKADDNINFCDCVSCLNHTNHLGDMTELIANVPLSTNQTKSPDSIRHQCVYNSRNCPSYSWNHERVHRIRGHVINSKTGGGIRGGNVRFCQNSLRQNGPFPLKSRNSFFLCRQCFNDPTWGEEDKDITLSTGNNLSTRQVCT